MRGVGEDTATEAAGQVGQVATSVSAWTPALWGWTDWLSVIMLLAGGFFVFVGGLGAVRMPNFYTRMHAASLTDSLGSLLILVGLMFQASFSLVTLKLAAIAVFLYFTAPVAAYALANAAVLSGHEPIGDELEEVSSYSENDPGVRHGPEAGAKEGTPP